MFIICFRLIDQHTNCTRNLGTLFIDMTHHNMPLHGGCMFWEDEDTKYIWQAMGMGSRQIAKGTGECQHDRQHHSSSCGIKMAHGPPLQGIIWC